MIVTVTEINDSYQALRRALQANNTAAIAEVDAKTALEAEKCRALADGRIEGKNAELREASARQVLAPLYEAYEAAARTAADAKLALELARIEVSRVQALLRVVEANAAATREVVG